MGIELVDGPMKMDLAAVAGQPVIAEVRRGVEVARLLRTKGTHVEGPKQSGRRVFGLERRWVDSWSQA